MNLTEWIGRLLNIENLERIESIDPTLAAPWAQSLPWLALLLALAAFVGGLAFYLVSQRRGSTTTRVALGTIRGLVLALLVLLLADPVLSLKLTNKPRPHLWVLIDTSESMNLRDELADEDREALHQAVGLTADQYSEEGPPTRQDYLRALFTKQEDNLLERLGEEFRIRTFLFDRPAGVRGVALSDSEDEPLQPARLAEALNDDGETTAIGSALDELGRRHSGTNLAGVVIFSDFDQNAGPPALDAAQRLKVPVYSVGVGPESARDLAVDLEAPLVLDKGERKTLRVRLRQTGFAGQEVRVEALAQRIDGPAEASMATEPVAPGKNVMLEEATTVVEIPYEPKEPGRYLVSVEIEPLPGEVVSQNNRSEREVQVRDDFRRLMYVEYEPTWEWRFIKEVFYRDPLVGQEGFRTFLASSDPRVRHTQELFMPTLTPPRKQFFANDVIFLGDVPMNALSTRFCEMVREFVSEFGGGLVIISGPKFGPSQLKGTPLESMLPVRVGAGLRIKDEPFRLRRTAEAEQFDFMRLGDTDDENDMAWQNMGELPWYQPVEGVVPGSTVLAEHPTDTCADGRTRQPLVAHRQFGSAGGQVVYLGFDETWRLRREYGERYYRRFWGQMIYRLAFSHALGTAKRFVVETDRQNYRIDDRVTLTVKAYDANYEPLPADDVLGGTLTAEILRPGRSPGEPPETERVSVAMLRTGVFEAQVPVFAAGAHRIRVQDPVSGEFMDTQFTVANVSVERRSAVRNTALQNELASATRGRSYDLTTVASLPEEVRYELQTQTNIRIIPLWTTWLCFSLIVGLLLVEWMVRKTINLP